MSDNRYAIYVDRAIRIREWLKESVDGADFGGIDLSAGTTKVYFRSMAALAGTFVHDEEMSLSADEDSVTAIAQYWATFTAAATGVIIRIVIVDELVGSQPTPSTYREIVARQWTNDVIDSTQP